MSNTLTKSRVVLIDHGPSSTSRWTALGELCESEALRHWGGDPRQWQPGLAVIVGVYREFQKVAAIMKQYPKPTPQEPAQNTWSTRERFAAPPAKSADSYIVISRDLDPVADRDLIS